MSDHRDNPLAATVILAETSEDDLFVEAKPEEKLKIIRGYEKKRKTCRDDR